MHYVCRWHVRWARLAAPLVSSLLIAGCGSEPNQVARTDDLSTVGVQATGTLQPCGDPSLQPLEPAASATPVAHYPAEELERPARLARPFPLADPRSPLPFISIPRPSIRGVHPAESAKGLGDTLNATDGPPQSDGIEPLPPIDDAQAVEALPPVDIPGDVEPLPEIEPLPEVASSAQPEPPPQAERAPAIEPSPAVEPLPEVESLPEVDLPDELPAEETPVESSNGPMIGPHYRAGEDPSPPPAEAGRAAPPAAFSIETQAPVAAPASRVATPPAPFATEVESESSGPKPPAAATSSSTGGGSIRRLASMEAVSRQAQQMIQHGYELGGRGALYSARAEFISALRTIAQALDVQTGNRQHTQALAAGLKALEEAEHFIPQGSRLEADLDIGSLVRAHRTPVAKVLPEDKLLPVIVLQRYYTFAQEQLAAAGGAEEAASMALFGLGKTYTALAGQQAPSIVAPEPKAMVFHQAALSTDPGNFLAANELAVLASHYGQYATARALLQYSISISPHSSVWKNLAAVHKRLGEEQLAQAAEREALAATRREATAKLGNREGIIPSSEITWVDPATFSGVARQTVEWHQPAAVNATKSEKPAEAAPDRAARKGWSGWWR